VHQCSEDHPTRNGNPAVAYFAADLSSQAQIRSAVEKFGEMYDHLDILRNNAGTAILLRKDSVDGFELTFAVNHLAHFLLTNLLIGALKNSSCQGWLMLLRRPLQQH
jgi:NAD(P)-dependent dehydrogenase (short-subunit alcohol dehydrogenase family)